MRIQVALYMTLFVASCAGMGGTAGPKVMRAHSDGTATIELSSLDLQIRAPQGVEFEKNTDSMVELRWGAGTAASPVHYVKIEPKTKYQSAEQLETEMQTAATAYQSGEAAKLVNGWDSYYSWLTDGVVRKMSYYGSLTIRDKTYSCYSSTGETMDGIRAIRKACRTLSAPGASPVEPAPAEPAPPETAPADGTAPSDPAEENAADPTDPATGTN